MTPRDIIERLGLSPHPEGGWYRETWRAEASDGDRAVGTAIYYLLEGGQVSRWHRVDATEIWHWYAGAALELTLSLDGSRRETEVVGADIGAGERPQIVVPAGCWQSAVSRGGFTLVGCTVAPGFEFRGFELAPDGWEPGR
ncbi:MAG TPA: cupin domain-containing protein [Thermohalobaculum sp.]|nr:cupin domain-containing protein [Thermohalobaculum sp.]